MLKRDGMQPSPLPFFHFAAKTGAQVCNGVLQAFPNDVIACFDVRRSWVVKPYWIIILQQLRRYNNGSAGDRIKKCKQSVAHFVAKGILDDFRERDIEERSGYIFFSHFKIPCAKIFKGDFHIRISNGNAVECMQ